MNKPEHFECMEGYAVFRPTGDVSLQEAAQLITSAIAFAREQHITKLLVNIIDLTGFEPPNLAAKYFFFREWARVAQGQVWVAFAARSEMIDREKMGILVGENAGLHSDAFTSEKEALAWLQGVK